ncbi:MAG: 23S rRNA (pseudouridine(1915)-N(3))-methyltransferase RlmH [Gemmatimonadota bacterium]|nr:MAG: 23S rRNA (pseudouridine(1915)-N(3))-methyltransferase RlmH [Gemmatimonadota bacterium]
MKVLILGAGKPGRLLSGAIREYEVRAGRYFPLNVVEVTGGRSASRIEAEADRLVGRVPEGFDVVALTRQGRRWSSRKLARYLARLGLDRRPGVAFVVGGPFGLGEALLERATHRLSLSALSLPRDIARLLLAEQVYRAGTLIRGEPYHKGG